MRGTYDPLEGIDMKKLPVAVQAAYWADPYSAKRSEREFEEEAVKERARLIAMPPDERQELRKRLELSLGEYFVAGNLFTETIPNS